MTELTTAEVLETVAREVARAVLTASGTPTKPRTPTTPRPGHKPLSTPKPIKPVRRAVDRQALAVAVHEAGHAVAGVMLGADLRSAAVCNTRGTEVYGRTFFRDRPLGTDPLIAFSGPWAQARFLAGGRRPSQREFYAVMDTAGCHDRKVLTAAGGLHTGADVEPIITRTWPAVLTLARQLHLTGEILHEDVLRALGVDTTRNVGAQLSEIRSGYQPVPPFTTKQPVPA